MTKNNFHIVMILLITIVMGCSHDDKLLIDGMSLDMWAARLSSEETEVKLDALETINSFGMRAIKLENQLLFIARHDADNEVKYNTVKILESLNLPTGEFSDFLELYNAPIIPVMSESSVLYSSSGSIMSDKAAVIDDLNYLKELLAEVPEQSRTDVMTVPSEPDEYETWLSSMRSESITELIQMLNNPDILLELLRTGDQQEKSFAFDKLSSLEDLNPKIVDAMRDIPNMLSDSKSLNSKDLEVLIRQKYNNK